MISGFSPSITTFTLAPCCMKPIPCSISVAAQEYGPSPWQSHTPRHISQRLTLLHRRLSRRSNVSFLKADAEQDWTFVQHQFNFIHGRMLTSGIHDWPALLSRCWNHLRPEGWLELLDVCHPFRAEDSTADSSSSSLIRWGYQAERCWAKNGLDYRASTKHLERLRDLGFVETEERTLK